MSSSASGRPSAQGSPEYAARYEQQTGYPPDTRQAQYEGQRRSGAGAAAGSILAGVLMIIGGAIAFLNGLAMVIRGGSFYTNNPAYYYHWSTSGWGYITLVLGGLVFLTGVCVLLGMFWARAVGVLIVALSAIAHFLTIPYYPLWSIVMIAFDAFIIWALCAPRRSDRYV